MSDTKLQVYLFFNGQCQEAMDFYKQVFGGDLTVMKFGDVPGNTDETMKDKVIHADLHNDEITILASDYAGESRGVGPVELCLVSSDEQKIRAYFDGLSSGGKVRAPLKQEFWGDIFGSLTDKFGINWMFNVDSGKNTDTPQS